MISIKYILIKIQILNYIFSMLKKKEKRKNFIIKKLLIFFLNKNKIKKNYKKNKKIK